jgi:hypothetical protein
MPDRACAAAAALTFVLVAPAAFGDVGDRVTILDPVGDTAEQDAAAYLDLVQLEVVDDGDGYSFICAVAGEVPEDPVGDLHSERIKFISWHWGVETDPASDPAGYPVAGSHSLPYEYMVNVWAGEGGLAADWLDRRPLVDGGEVIATPLELIVDGPRLIVSVPRTVFDPRDGFLWRIGITAHRSHFGNMGYDALDVAAFPFTPSP